MCERNNGMEIICAKHCVIGEGPIQNPLDKALYFTNAGGNEICRLETDTGQLFVIPVQIGVSAIAFDEEGSMLVSRSDGVFRFKNGAIEPLYDTERHQILYANDMKVGPDGRLYVGTQSDKRKGVSDRVNGKLYSIDKNGTVRQLLDGLILSNGLEWSMDETRFYHTDSDTRIIREYAFDKQSGSIEATGREVYVHGVDGFTIDQNDLLYAACWGRSHVAVVDTRTMEIVEYIDIPAKIPASCAFAGEDMRTLVVVTASYHANPETDPYAGYTFALHRAVGGRLPYLFSIKHSRGKTS